MQRLSTGFSKKILKAAEIKSPSRIEGKFYPLRNDEWLQICRSLTKSQISILYYLRSLDPYSNGINIKASKIAEDLGISKRSVNAAIAVLQEKGYINLQDVEYSVKIMAGGCLDAEDEAEPEPPKKEKEKAKDKEKNKEFSNFINSLSEKEREEFWEFCQRKIEGLPTPPTLPRRWIEANWEDLSNQWLRERQSSSANDEDWENHPQKEEWIEKVRKLGPWGFQAEARNREEEKLYHNFAWWAIDNGLIYPN